MPLGTGAIAGAVSIGLPIALGAAEVIGSISKKRKARQLEPPMEDTEQRQLLNELMRKRKAIQTGAGYSETLKEIREQQATTQRGMERAAGGAGGALIAGLAKASRVAGHSFSELMAKEEEKGLTYTQLAMKALDDISQRKLELQAAKYGQALADAQGLKRAGMSNILSLVSKLGGGAGEGKADILTQLLRSMGTPSEMPTTTPDLLGERMPLSAPAMSMDIPELGPGLTSNIDLGTELTGAVAGGAVAVP